VRIRNGILLFCFLLLQGCASFFEDLRRTPETAAQSPPVQTDRPAENSAVSLFAPRVTAEKALGWLKNGNTRFVNGHLRNDGQSKADRQRTFAAQKPHSIVLSCSDSNAPPEIIFDQKLGEIYVIRTSAHTVDDAVVASLEYAVAHLGPQNLVVMGHTYCGPIESALENVSDHHHLSPLLSELSRTILPNLKSSSALTPAAGYRNEAWAHVRGVIAEIQTRSALLSERIQAGQLQINPALYDTETGLVEFQSLNR